MHVPLVLQSSQNVWGILRWDICRLPCMHTCCDHSALHSGGEQFLGKSAKITCIWPIFKYLLEKVHRYVPYKKTKVTMLTNCSGVKWHCFVLHAQGKWRISWKQFQQMLHNISTIWSRLLSVLQVIYERPMDQVYWMRQHLQHNAWLSVLLTQI